MTTPTFTPYPGNLPAKEQSNPVLDTNVDDFLTWLTDTNGPELATFVTYAQDVADNVLATALAGDLPPLTGKAGNYLRANAGEDGGEFRTTVQVLADIAGAPLASPEFTGNPIAPTQTLGNNSTRIATTAFVLANGAAAVEEVLSTTVISTAVSSVDFTFDETLYYSVRFELYDVRPQTNGENIVLRTSANEGSSYDSGASDYDYSVSGSDAQGTSLRTNNDVGASFMALSSQTVIDDADGGMSGEIKVYNVSDTSETRVSGLLSFRKNGGDYMSSSIVAGARISAAVVNGVQFLTSSGNLAHGTIRMIGVLK